MLNGITYIVRPGKQNADRCRYTKLKTSHVHSDTARNSLPQTGQHLPWHYKVLVVSLFINHFKSNI